MQASHTVGPLPCPENQSVTIGDNVNASWNAITEPSIIMDEQGDPTYRILVDFERNYTILILVIPLIAIFYLLGAIFIFDNTMDQIGSRLTLTLGIFALIFTLPDIINSMKPEVAVGPTIADSLLSLIIIATIVFTISSIISSSPVIQKWFPRHHRWIDVGIFILMSGFVVTLLWNYSTSIIHWLVPIIILGMGYGLLLKVLGLKITKPISNLSLFRKFKLSKKSNG
jgi:hypothetical protein